MEIICCFKIIFNLPVQVYKMLFLLLISGYLCAGFLQYHTRTVLFRIKKGSQERVAPLFSDIARSRWEKNCSFFWHPSLPPAIYANLILTDLARLQILQYSTDFHGNRNLAGWLAACIHSKIWDRLDFGEI